MRKFVMMGPSGRMETTAPTPEKAKQNFRFRLAKEYGMGWYRAREYDFSDLKEVKP